LQRLATLIAAAQEKAEAREGTGGKATGKEAKP